MAISWILGYIFAAILIWIGLSKHVGTMRPSFRQILAAAGFLLLILMIAFTTDKVFDWWVKFPKSAVGVLGILIVLDRFVRIAVLPGRGGNLLLDLGRIGGVEVIVNIVVALALAWYTLKDTSDIIQTPGWKFGDISYQMFGLAIALGVLIQGVSKRKLLENGVFLGTSFLAWGKIEHYSWEKDSGAAAVLVLHKRTGVPFFTTSVISVRIEHTKQIEEILQQHNISLKAEGPTIEP